MEEKNCNQCAHYDACCKWTDFPKQCGIPVCLRFTEKSEVAKEFTCFVGDPHKVEYCPYLDEIEKAKFEVAREIFGEIGRRMICTNEEDFRVFTELKKKYGVN